VHQSHRAPPGAYRSRVRNPSFRTPGSRGRVQAGALKPRWTWRDLFLSGCSPPGYARIALTPARVRPAQGAAIVEGERDEGGVSCEWFYVNYLLPLSIH